MRLLIFLISFLSYSFASATDSSSVWLDTLTPSTVFVVDSGYVDTHAITTAEQTFYTSKQCPTGFRPFVTLSVDAVDQYSGSYSPSAPTTLNAFASCVGFVGPSGSGYVVGYVALARYNAARQSIYGSTSSGSYNSTAIYGLGGGGYSYDRAQRGPQGIYWQLSCYPSSSPMYSNITPYSGRNWGGNFYSNIFLYSNNLRCRADMNSPPYSN